jgi:hypothetical protein
MKRDQQDPFFVSESGFQSASDVNYDRFYQHTSRNRVEPAPMFLV